MRTDRRRAQGHLDEAGCGDWGGHAVNASERRDIVQGQGEEEAVGHICIGLSYIHTCLIHLTVLMADGCGVGRVDF